MSLAEPALVKAMKPTAMLLILLVGLVLSLATICSCGGQTSGTLTYNVNFCQQKSLSVAAGTVQGTEVDLSLSFNTNSLTNVSLGRMLPVAFNITYTSQTTSLLAGQRNASRARMFIQILNDATGGVVSEEQQFVSWIANADGTVLTVSWLITPIDSVNEQNLLIAVSSLQQDDPKLVPGGWPSCNVDVTNGTLLSASPQVAYQGLYALYNNSPCCIWSKAWNACVDASIFPELHLSYTLEVSSNPASASKLSIFGGYVGGTNSARIMEANFFMEDAHNVQCSLLTQNQDQGSTSAIYIVLDKPSLPTSCQDASVQYELYLPSLTVDMGINYNDDLVYGWPSDTVQADYIFRRGAAFTWNLLHQTSLFPYDMRSSTSALTNSGYFHVTVTADFSQWTGIPSSTAAASAELDTWSTVFATYMSQEGGSALQKPAVEILSAVVTYPNWPSTLAGGPMIFKFQGQYNLAANIDAKELSWAATNYLLYHANDCLLPSWSLFQNRLWNIVDVSQVNGVFSATIYFLPEGMTSFQVNDALHYIFTSTDQSFDVFSQVTLTNADSFQFLELPKQPSAYGQIMFAVIGDTVADVTLTDATAKNFVASISYPLTGVLLAVSAPLLNAENKWETIITLDYASLDSYDILSAQNMRNDVLMPLAFQYFFQNQTLSLDPCKDNGSLVSILSWPAVVSLPLSSNPALHVTGEFVWQSQSDPVLIEKQLQSSVSNLLASCTSLTLAEATWRVTVGLSPFFSFPGRTSVFIDVVALPDASSAQALQTKLTESSFLKSFEGTTNGILDIKDVQISGFDTFAQKAGVTSQPILKCSLLLSNGNAIPFGSLSSLFIRNSISTSLSLPMTNVVITEALASNQDLYVSVEISAPDYISTQEIYFALLTVDSSSWIMSWTDQYPWVPYTEVAISGTPSFYWYGMEDNDILFIKGSSVSCVVAEPYCQVQVLKALMGHASTTARIQLEQIDGEFTFSGQIKYLHSTAQANDVIKSVLQADNSEFAVLSSSISKNYTSFQPPNEPYFAVSITVETSGSVLLSDSRENEEEIKKALQVVIPFVSLSEMEVLTAPCSSLMCSRVSIGTLPDVTGAVNVAQILGSSFQAVHDSCMSVIAGHLEYVNFIGMQVIYDSWVSPVISTSASATLLHNATPALLSDVYSICKKLFSVVLPDYQLWRVSVNDLSYTESHATFSCSLAQIPAAVWDSSILDTTTAAILFASKQIPSYGLVSLSDVQVQGCNVDKTTMPNGDHIYDVWNSPTASFQLALNRATFNGSFAFSIAEQNQILLALSTHLGLPLPSLGVTRIQMHIPDEQLFSDSASWVVDNSSSTSTYLVDEVVSAGSEMYWSEFHDVAAHVTQALKMLPADIFNNYWEGIEVSFVSPVSIGFPSRESYIELALSLEVCGSNLEQQSACQDIMPLVCPPSLPVKCFPFQVSCNISSVNGNCATMDTTVKFINNPVEAATFSTDIQIYLYKLMSVKPVAISDFSSVRVITWPIAFPFLEISGSVTCVTDVTSDMFWLNRYISNSNMAMSIAAYQGEQIGSDTTSVTLRFHPQHNLGEYQEEVQQFYSVMASLAAYMESFHVCSLQLIQPAIIVDPNRPSKPSVSFLSNNVKSNDSVIELLTAHGLPHVQKSQTNILPYNTTSTLVSIASVGSWSTIYSIKQAFASTANIYDVATSPPFVSWPIGYKPTPTLCRTSVTMSGFPILPWTTTSDVMLGDALSTFGEAAVVKVNVLSSVLAGDDKDEIEATVIFQKTPGVSFISDMDNIYTSCNQLLQMLQSSTSVYSKSLPSYVVSAETQVTVWPGVDRSYDSLDFQYGFIDFSGYIRQNGTQVNEVVELVKKYNLVAMYNTRIDTFSDSLRLSLFDFQSESDSDYAVSQVWQALSLTNFSAISGLSFLKMSSSLQSCSATLLEASTSVKLYMNVGADRDAFVEGSNVLEYLANTIAGSYKTSSRVTNVTSDTDGILYSIRVCNIDASDAITIKNQLGNATSALKNDATALQTLTQFTRDTLVQRLEVRTYSTVVLPETQETSYLYSFTAYVQRDTDDWWSILDVASFVTWNVLSQDTYFVSMVEQWQIYGVVSSVSSKWMQNASGTSSFVTAVTVNVQLSGSSPTPEYITLSHEQLCNLQEYLHNSLYAASLADLAIVDAVVCNVEFTSTSQAPYVSFTASLYSADLSSPTDTEVQCIQEAMAWGMGAGTGVFDISITVLTTSPGWIYVSVNIRLARLDPFDAASQALDLLTHNNVLTLFPSAKLINIVDFPLPSPLPEAFYSATYVSTSNVDAFVLINKITDTYPNSLIFSYMTYEQNTTVQLMLLPADMHMLADEGDGIGMELNSLVLYDTVINDDKFQYMGSVNVNSTYNESVSSFIIIRNALAILLNIPQKLLVVSVDASTVTYQMMEGSFLDPLTAISSWKSLQLGDVLWSSIPLCSGSCHDIVSLTPAFPFSFPASCMGSSTAANMNTAAISCAGQASVSVVVKIACMDQQ